MEQSSPSHTTRGQRVPRMSDQSLVAFASHVAKILKINRHTANLMENFIDDLHDNFGIVTHIIPDNEWLMSSHVKALCDPNNGTIGMPESVYRQIALSDSEAIGIFFHELGHLFLSHRATLHYDIDDSHPYDEDAEYQADRFSDAMLYFMGILGDAKQVKLF